MEYSVAYFTNRLEPQFEWFVEALSEQAANDLSEIQLVLVDYWLAPGHPHKIPDGRRAYMASVVDGMCSFLHIPPKPTPWQGAHRQTSRDWFAASNARNTALIVADGRTFVGVDDLSVPLPGWWDQVRHSAEHGYLGMGSYRKVRDLVVEGGRVVRYRDDGDGIDSRWNTGSDGGIVPAPGHHLFGCNMALPLEVALKVDGFESWCDRIGSEDTDFGMRVQRTGCPCYYNRNQCTLECADGHEREPSLKRDKCRVPAERLPKALEGAFPQGLDSDHVLVKALISDGGRTQPLERNDLKGQRELWRKEGRFMEPACGAYDWASGLSLSQL